MTQFNKLVEFRHAVYAHGLLLRRDAQFELLDAVLLSAWVRSFPELSLSPAFRRGWSSAYGAVEEGTQDWGWLEQYFIQQLPNPAVQVYALDETAWPHPQARVLADCQYVYSPTTAVNSKSVVVAHPYSKLGWVPEAHGSWALPVSVERIPSQQTAVAVGVAQVKRLCRARHAEMQQALHLIAADGKYGNHRFLGPLRDEPCGAVVRMRRDRVLYGNPGPYAGRGRPRKHGARFAFKEPATWGPPAVDVALEDEHWGHVRLRRWDDLHARQDADTPFSVLLVEAHREREKPTAPLWLAYQPPAHQTPDDQPVEVIWRGYGARWPIEPSIRFSKQYLYWTLPRFQSPEACDRWTMLVNLAQWELWLARAVVRDQPWPWQPPQERLTPERTRQSLGALFQQIGTPAAPPKTRGKAPGWPTGTPRQPKPRHRVVRKTKKKPKTAQPAA
jgi:hypothetical protein